MVAKSQHKQTELEPTEPNVGSNAPPKARGKSTGPKAKGKKQSDAFDRRVNELDLQGFSGPQIGAQLGMSKQGVNYRLKKLNARTIISRSHALEKEIRILDYAQHESIRAWEASKLPAEVVSVEQHGSGARAETKATKRTSTSSGESQHLANVIKVSESRRKLLGIDAASRIALEPSPSVDWTRVDDSTQIDFLDGRITLLEIIRMLGPAK